jgi:hypothetical protein
VSELYHVDCHKRAETQALRCVVVAHAAAACRCGPCCRARSRRYASVWRRT